MQQCKQEQHSPVNVACRQTDPYCCNLLAMLQETTANAAAACQALVQSKSITLCTIMCVLRESLCSASGQLTWKTATPTPTAFLVHAVRAIEHAYVVNGAAGQADLLKLACFLPPQIKSAVATSLFGALHLECAQCAPAILPPSPSVSDNVWALGVIINQMLRAACKRGSLLPVRFGNLEAMPIAGTVSKLGGALQSVYGSEQPSGMTLCDSTVLS